MDKIVLVVILVAVFSANSGALPTSTSTTTTEKNDKSEQEIGTTAGAPQDLYVIKTIVYEVGILTDAGNSTEDNSTHEQVDLTFFDPSTNGSVIDLSSIPVPLQTNVSGVSLTGIVPDLGAALPDKQVKVTQNISTSDPEKGAQIISNLPKLLGLESDKNGSLKVADKS